MNDTTTALEPLAARLAETAPGLRVETGPGSTGLYAYDASNYRVPPRAVVFPRDADDVVAVLRACRETHVPVTARGGGTSMAGNAIGPGVVLDFSRYMYTAGDSFVMKPGFVGVWKAVETVRKIYVTVK
ncbi:FAD/FMN-containing dehydrogenase [Streptomyces afghaniensis]|nr:FAD/FMN-containing dehydrogenase [Streptomyces afghaniensis]